MTATAMITAMPSTADLSSSGMAATETSSKAAAAVKEPPHSKKQQQHQSSETQTAATMEYHEPPPNVDYTTNDTIFGSILRGESPAKILNETPYTLSFHDINPRAQLHALVIPKQHIPSVLSLRNSTNILNEMKQSAHDILQQEQPIAYANNDYILCFHIPPFNSVDHLHLHVLAPASQMSWYSRYVRYTKTSHRRWCISLDKTMECCSNEKSIIVNSWFGLRTTCAKKATKTTNATKMPTLLRWKKRSSSIETLSSTSSSNSSDSDSE